MSSSSEESDSENSDSGKGNKRTSSFTLLSSSGDSLGSEGDWRLVSDRGSDRENRAPTPRTPGARGRPATAAKPGRRQLPPVQPPRSVPAAPRPKGPNVAAASADPFAAPDAAGAPVLSGAAFKKQRDVLARQLFLA